MSNLWKVVIAVVITLAVVGGGTYYYMNGKAVREKNDLRAKIDDLSAKVDDLTAKQEAAVVATGSLTTGSTVTTGAAVSSWKNYTNAKYGFSLTFNDLWKNFQVVDVKSEDATALSYLYVCVPTTSTIWNEKNAESGLFCPFAIDVVAKASKAAFEAANDPMIPTLITSNSAYVYYWSSAQDAPTDGQTIFPDSKNIIATFKAN